MYPSSHGHSIRGRRGGNCNPASSSRGPVRLPCHVSMLHSSPTKSQSTAPICLVSHSQFCRQYPALVVGCWASSNQPCGWSALIIQWGRTALTAPHCDTEPTEFSLLSPSSTKYCALGLAHRVPTVKSHPLSASSPR